MYRTQLESMLVQHVFPEFKSPLGYLRARVGKEKRKHCLKWLTIISLLCDTFKKWHCHVECDCYIYLCLEQIINSYWMRLSIIWRIREIKEDVICQGCRMRLITTPEISIILQMMLKLNQIIFLIPILKTSKNMLTSIDVAFIFDSAR